MTVSVGSVELANPVMTASGTSGHGAELASYVDLGILGAVVVKSMSHDAWAGNPPPRVRACPGGMLNSVGLQGPGVGVWLEEHLPGLLATGASVVASIWGRRVEEFASVAAKLSDSPPGVIAVEVNVSCPNLADGQLFAYSPSATAGAVEAARACGRPVWAKLSAGVANLCEIGAAALGAGAEALTLINTLPGLAIDLDTWRPALGGGGGGLSGPAIRPLAVKAVYECRMAFPTAGIVGVGGVTSGKDAAEMMLAGADAVQVGTASFADPRSASRVLKELARWCTDRGVGRVGELTGAAHERQGS